MQPTQHKQSVRALIDQAERSLACGPHPERARPDAETLLLHILRKELPHANRAWLIAHADDALEDSTCIEFASFIARRALGEPIQYITGETEFYGLTFRVTRDVLIPRPETEHLVENVMALAAQFPRPRIVDVGTGSGAIAIALAHQLPNAQITAVDLSPAALSIAQQNATLNGVADRICFLCGDLLEPVSPDGASFEIVVSNPPYVPEADRPTLSVEVRDHEPGLALFAGQDGLDVYRRLIPSASSCLASGGWIALEIGFGQTAAVSALLAASGFCGIELSADLRGIPRTVCAHQR